MINGSKETQVEMRVYMFAVNVEGPFTKMING